jgi:hypothetical protein
MRRRIRPSGVKCTRRGAPAARRPHSSVATERGGLVSVDIRRRLRRVRDFARSIFNYSLLRSPTRPLAAAPTSHIVGDRNKLHGRSTSRSSQAAAPAASATVATRGDDVVDFMQSTFTLRQLRRSQFPVMRPLSRSSPFHGSSASLTGIRLQICAATAADELRRLAAKRLRSANT